MTLADALLHIARLLPSVKNLSLSIKDKRQEKALNLLEAFHECLEKLADDLENRKVPAERCAELEYYLRTLYYDSSNWTGISKAELDGARRVLGEASHRPSTLATILKRLENDTGILLSNDRSNFNDASFGIADPGSDEPDFAKEVEKIRASAGTLRAMKNIVGTRDH